MESEPRDSVQTDGFVNVTVRNFSIKRRSLERGPLFDAEFAYSTTKGFGFGWEDVELGYRLYAAGAVIRYTDQAFSVRCSRDPSTPEPRDVLGSMRDFSAAVPEASGFGAGGAAVGDRRLRPHRRTGLTPTASATASRATGSTSCSASSAARSSRYSPAQRRSARRLRILTYRWHAPHQYELYKLPHDFTLATGLGDGMTDVWQYDQRPLRPNARMLPIVADRPARL